MALLKQKYDIFAFFGLFAVSIAINYFTPSFFRFLWFFGLLAVFFFAKSKHNHFWIIFFWLIFSEPGYLFYSRGVYHLPTISVAGLGREVSFSELFAIIAVCKALLYPLKQQVFYRKPLFQLIGYSVFLLFLGFAYGMGLLTFLKSIRYFIPILLLPAIPRLIPYHTVQQAIMLMFLCVFVLLPAQLFDVVFGYPMAAAFGETQFMFSGREVGLDFRAFDVAQGPVRTIYGPFILLFGVVLGVIQLLRVNGRNDNSWFVNLVPFMAAFSIFLSGTRGWIVGVGIVLVGFALNQTKTFGKYIASGVLLLALVFTIPQVNQQIAQVWDRVATLQSLAEGDFTADGTLKRITERGPRVMNKFWESPVFGFGFSDEYYEFADGHVGNQTLLLNGGIVGYLFFLYYIVFLLQKFFKQYYLSKQKEMLVFFLGLVALLAIHSSSAMVFGFAMDVNKGIALGLFFFFSDYYLKKAYLTT